MRSARNFHPEWGYLAPAPSLVSTVRIVLVATAVGTTAGASVVFSLVAHPAAETSEISVAARTLARPVRAASAPALTEVPAPTNAVPVPTASAAPATDPAPVQKKATKKHHFASRYASRSGPFELLPGEYYYRTYGDRREGY